MSQAGAALRVLLPSARSSRQLKVMRDALADHRGGCKRCGDPLSAALMHQLMRRWRERRQLTALESAASAKGGADPHALRSSEMARNGALVSESQHSGRKGERQASGMDTCPWQK